MMGGKSKLPFSLEAERAVLGAVMCSPDNLISIENILKADHFFLDQHKSIFGAITELSAEGLGVDVITVADRLKANTATDSASVEITYLADLLSESPVTRNIEHYADIVKRDALTRRIVKCCSEVVEKATKYEGSAQSYIEDIEKEFLKISGDYDKKGILLAGPVLESTIEMLQKQIENDGETTGVPTGFLELDALTGGFQRGDLILIGARPGMGKTAFALNMATNAAMKGYHAVAFTLEMPKEQLMQRILSSISMVDSSRLRKGKVDDQEMDQLMEGARRVYQVQQYLGIDESPQISLSELRSRCRRHQKEHGLDIVFIDYLQLMSGSKNKNRNREQEVAEISKGLKSMAIELKVSVVSLTQLNRGPESRQGADKRPRTSDLRESGSIEQDADMVLLVYRDEYYFPNSELTGIAEIIVGKNRHGSSGQTIKLGFQPNFVAFQNLALEGGC